MLKDLITAKKMETAARMPDLTKIKTGVNKQRRGRPKKAQKEPEVPEDVYRKCTFCGKPILNRDVRSNLYRCPRCGGYFRVHARRRIELIADSGSFQELDEHMPTVNPLSFPDYEEKLDEQRRRTGLDEAVVTGICTIDGEKAVLCVMDNRFIMSSMGYNVGEKLVRAIERADKDGLPVIIYCASGGARMQEGIVSLMQMAKTSAAVRRHRELGLLYISVLTNPTMGGVTASFAMLGDVILAEPDALIGFAGPRVIEQTIGEKLPEGFQRSEFLLKHGCVDMIAGREEQKQLIARLIRAHDIKGGKKKLRKLCQEPMAGGQAYEAGSVVSPGKEASGAQAEKATALQSQRADKSAWDKVQQSRDPGRPRALDMINLLFSDFTELHGDRCYGDDPAIVGGLAFFHGMPVTVIAEQKGKNIKDNVARNFGMPKPEGYRKALRLMKEADAFLRPVICFVDTPGAYPGISSEERGQGEAIARCIYELSGLRVPVLSLVISEGGSGGALALAVADEVWMMENATYSILSPEGFASILYKDAKRAREAAGYMKITAHELLELGVVDEVIEEPAKFDIDSLGSVMDELDRKLSDFLKRMEQKSPDEVKTDRYSRFRAF